MSQYGWRDGEDIPRWEKVGAAPEQIDPLKDNTLPTFWDVAQQCQLATLKEYGDDAFFRIKTTGAGRNAVVTISGTRPGGFAKTTITFSRAEMDAGGFYYDTEYWIVTGMDEAGIPRGKEQDYLVRLWTLDRFDPMKHTL